MQTQQWLIRVRSQRMAVLIAEDAEKDTFLSVIDFLSRVWGGRYSPVIIVGKKDNGAEAKRVLSMMRPDSVMGVEIPHKKWINICEDTCQPRRYLAFERDRVDELEQINPLHHIWARSIVRAVINESPTLERSNLVLWKPTSKAMFRLLMAVCFGVLSDELTSAFSQALNAKESKLEDSVDTAGYLEACTEMSKKWSWLDFASLRLRRKYISGNFFFPPTVVVIQHMVSDLAMFWNLRMQSDLGATGYFIPFPAKETDSKSSVEALAQWIVRTPANANYCLLRSRTCPRPDMDRLARRLRSRIRGSKIEHVDIEDTLVTTPRIIPYERETHERVFVTDRSVSLDVVRPWCVDSLNSADGWLCDIIKDIKTGRAPHELCLPPRKSVHQVLNTPFPPSVRFGTPLLGYGLDSVNYHCDKRTPAISFGVFTAKELIGEILLERGVNLTKDEKRIRYDQAINIFGDFLEAARDLSGSSLKVIEILKSHEQLTLNEIMSKAKLGKLAKWEPPKYLEFFLGNMAKHTARITKNRFDAYYRGERHLKVEDILNRLVKTGVVHHKWKLDRCEFCDKSYWVDHLDITVPLVCPGCRKRVLLKDRVEVGYQLNELIALAIQEGMVPVILTARFLHNLTSEGFIWLAGAKCSHSEHETDFDLLACCDGHLVAVECKSLTDIGNDSPVWLKIQDQLKKPIKLAKLIGVDVFAVAALCKEFPKGFIETVSKMAGKDITTIFLNRHDLEQGWRTIPINKDKTSTMCLHDVLPKTLPAQKRRRRKRKPRQLSFP